MQSEQKNKYQAYAAATQTVARTKQIVLLYDGVIRFVQQAKEAIEQGRIEDRYKLLIKASDIISGMQACLDFEKGGDVAKILYSFYSSVDGRIFAIHRTSSLESCDQIIADLRQMREVWHEIDQIDGGGAPAGEPSQTPPPATGLDGVTLSA